MIIGVCGNGYCGSSAVTDFLRENPALSVSDYDIEFNFLYDVDGLDDLYHHVAERSVRFYSSDAAIKRFRAFISYVDSPNGVMRKQCKNALSEATEAFLSELTELSWNGWWHYDVRNASAFDKNFYFRLRVRLNSLWKKLFHKELSVYPKGRMHYAGDKENAERAVKRYVEKLVSFFNPENREVTVLDQPYPVGQADLYRKYFTEEVKTVTVIRDPRDLYLSAKAVNPADSTFIPYADVRQFVTYFKNICAYLKPLSENELVVRFEDLIYRYEETTEEICRFIGTDTVRTKAYFDPAVSVHNTQLFKNFPEYEDDIAYIERELREWLYDYGETPFSPSASKAF